MPNTNPQAIRIANDNIRPAADRFGQLYNLMKAYQAEAVAEDWLALFPANSEIIEDGSATDGRAPITNQEVRDFIQTVITPYINFMEANSFVLRNLTLKIAVNPVVR